MQLEIKSNKKITELQQEFNTFFPFLKLDFFGGGDEHIISSQEIWPTTEKTLGEFKKMNNAGVIMLSPEMLVVDLEKIFKESFGISATILRKAGNIWIHTRYSNSWSLQKQNEQGQITCKNLDDQKAKRKNN